MYANRRECRRADPRRSRKSGEVISGLDTTTTRVYSTRVDTSHFTLVSKLGENTHMITDTIRKSLEGIKAEIHVLLSTLPHTEDEVRFRLNTIGNHLATAGADAGDLERWAKQYLETENGKELLDKLVREANNLENSAKVADSHSGIGSVAVRPAIEGLAITATTTESHDTGTTAAVTNSELVTDPTTEPVEPVVSLGAESNIGASGTE